MKRVGPALAYMLFACGPGGGRSGVVAVPAASHAQVAPAAPTASVPPDPASVGDARERRLIAKMLKQVEAARGFASRRAVPGKVLERGALIARVKDHVAQEVPPEAIRNEGLSLQLFGFVPLQFDYQAAEYKLLEDQLAGYYEPADGTMYMADDLPEDEAKATLAHELVHALQDQRWDLGTRSKYRPGDGDRSEAVSALAEGDATSAMFDVMIAEPAPGVLSSGRSAVDMPDEVFVAQIREGIASGPGADSPHVMRTSLAAPYVYGTLFIHALRRQGGWAAVNRAWDNPPTTTEQIMHVAKWVAHEVPLAVTAPTFAALGTGWKVSDEDSEGELGTRLGYEEWMSEDDAAHASEGWGGDREVLVVNGDRAAFAWRLRYDPGTKSNDDRAVAAFAAVSRGIDRTLRAAPSASDAAFDCHERPERGPIAVARFAADLVFIAGPTTTAPGGAWKSAGDCALARRWSKEIAGTP
jgi:hypothetical protein